MGNCYYIGCVKCKEMIFLGKIPEWNCFKKDLLTFLYSHLDCHNFILSGNELHLDDNMIKHIDHCTWDTDFKIINKEELYKDMEDVDYFK